MNISLPEFQINRKNETTVIVWTCSAVNGYDHDETPVLTMFCACMSLYYLSNNCKWYCSFILKKLAIRCCMQIFKNSTHFAIIMRKSVPCTEMNIRNNYNCWLQQRTFVFIKGSGKERVDYRLCARIVMLCSMFEYRNLFRLV